MRDILIRARELIADPAHWLKGMLCEGPIAGTDTECFCIVGAIDRAVLEKLGCIRDTGPDYDETMDLELAEGGPEGRAAIHAVQSHLQGLISDFNDDDGTFHADVLALLDKAIGDA